MMPILKLGKRLKIANSSWLSRKRRKTELAAHNGAAEYICQAASEEVTTVCGEANASDNASIGDSSSVTSSEEDLETLGDEEGTHCLQNNVDVARLFDEYKNKAKDMSTGDLLNIHELLTLTDILLSSPKQSSTLLLDAFSEQSIDTIYETLLNKIKANTKDLDDNAFFILYFNGFLRDHRSIHREA
ncbi:hypothetical protein INT48_007287 [Thamnidium elegans]|uniref:Uncharacterized protein n=1 Tax=Thamnidium elegans TaxID=101142 RepID=A0A8H7SQ35_9FUNG|nr:hypothetical protein INT48_007287 [Thamnidium elegans]